MGRNGNFQIRQNPQCCDNWEHMMSNGQWMCGKTHGACSHNGSNYGRKGGKLIGPSHERGGIPAIVGGQEAIELEGGEYIMNAQTTKALGVEFLDKLNSTATTYHQGGFQRGQLPGPSMYRDGGKVPNRRNNMRRGGRPVRRTKPVARGRKMARGGVHFAGSTHLNTINKGCSMYTGDVAGCNSQQECHYDYARETCVG